MASKALSDAAMRSKPTPAGAWFSDPAKRGEGKLQGRITPAGARMFYFRHLDADGRERRLPIGPYAPDGKGGFTLAQARGEAHKLSTLYRSGIRNLHAHFAQVQRDREQADADARAAAELARQEAERAAAAAARRITIHGLFAQWQRAELTPHLRADGTRTGRKDGGEWVRQSFERRVFPVLGDVAADDVRRADLLAILDDAKAEGRRRTANLLLADLRQMLRFATEREIVARNPLDGIRRAAIGGKDVERDRVLDDAELRALAAALPAARLHPRTEAAVWLILATGARVGEAMSARWEHVDPAARTWYLPVTKNQRDHTIHLSDFAMVQITKLSELRGAGTDGELVAWLFPATDPAEHVCTKSFGKQIADRQRRGEKRLSNRAKAVQSLALPGGKWTAHDLRRTAATLMARLGVPGDVIDECLNHKLQSKVARVYIRDRRVADQARAFDALGRKLSELRGGEAASNVVTLAPRAA